MRQAPASRSTGPSVFLQNVKRFSETVSDECVSNEETSVLDRGNVITPAGK